MIGKTISHYKIIEKLGEGGMGVVYKAEDTKLKRPVALKFLPPAFATDPTTKERFIHEAQAASALQHNNICAIHEIDETKPAPGEPGDGQMYIVMDYYEGETLKSKIEKGRLEIEETVDYTIQIAQGLQKAHEKGIIHRDIKPANIMITNDGEVKILDFGLAKFRGQTKITKTGSTLGTVAYMSPEQVRGEEVDHRTDIWSLGVILYEMLSGHLPFKGDYAEQLMYAIVNKEPEPVQKLRPDISSEFLHIINRALEKDAVNRYPNMNEILIDLKRIKRDTSKLSYKVPKEILPVSSKIAKRNIHWISAASVVAISILIFWYISNRTSQMQPDLAKDDRISIAVMPFENLTGDENYDIWQKGIPILIQAALSTSQEDLYVIDSKSTFEVLEDMRQVQTTNNIPSLAEEVATKLNVETFIMGTIFPARERIRLQVRFQDVKSGRLLTSKEVEGSINDDFIVMVDKLSSWVRNYLEIKIIDKNVTEYGPDIKPIAQNVTEYELRNVFTTSAEAYRHYLRGWEFWVSDDRRSIEEFTQAVLIDTNFTEAQLRLAIKYNDYAYSGNTAERLKKARKWADKAYSRKDILPQIYQLFLEGQYCDFKKTPYERIMWNKKILELEPEKRESLFHLGWLYCRLEQYEKAIDPLKKAVELSIQRRSSIYWDWAVGVLGISYHALGEHNKELELYENYYLVQGQEKIPENTVLIAELVSVYLCQKDTAQVQYYLNRLQQVLVEQGASEAEINVWFGYAYERRWYLYFSKNIMRLNKAEEYYRKAIALDQKAAKRGYGVSGLNSLAYLLIYHERDIDEGVELAQRAVQIEPENPQSLHPLGWGYYKQGKYELAVETLQKADDLIPRYDHNIRKQLEKAKAVLANQKVIN